MSKKLKPVILTALLSAIAAALYFIEFPLFPAASFLKLDLSDIPALFGSLLLGPGWGVLVEGIKNLIHLMFKGVGSQMGFGNIMNFVVGTAFILPYSLLYRSGIKRGRSEKKSGIIGSVVGIISIAAIGVGMNMVIMPLFFKYFVGREMSMAMIMGSIGYATALNGIKGLLLSFAAPLHRPLQRITDKM